MNAIAGYIPETAFTFTCDGKQLIGVLHLTANDTDLGLLTIVAGGPQYRGGCGRQLVELGRRLAGEGVAVMRFDHRGLGDSEGEFQGFQHIEADIEAAIVEFKRRMPNLERLILWGGCDAASAALMHAYKFPEVVAIIAANPFVSSDKTASIVMKKHYLSRLGQFTFWKKVLSMKYSPGDYLTSIFNKSSRDQPGNSSVQTLLNATNEKNSDYISKMLNGVNRFNGKLFLLMSGKSLVSREFDALVDSQPQWRQALQSRSCERHEIEGADQTFSSRESRVLMLDATSSWVKKVADQTCQE